MNARQFFDLVSAMRVEQKLYFQTRDRSHLSESKRLEMQVDKEISRVMRACYAPSLFDQEVK